MRALSWGYNGRCLKLTSCIQQVPNLGVYRTVLHMSLMLWCLLKHRANITTFTILHKVPSFKAIQIYSGVKTLHKAHFPKMEFKAVCGAEIGSFLVHTFHEAWVNTYNNRYSSFDNPRRINKEPLHSIKVMWCGSVQQELLDPLFLRENKFRKTN